MANMMVIVVLPAMLLLNGVKPNMLENQMKKNSVRKYGGTVRACRASKAW